MVTNNAPKNRPHKHAELIKAWADGYEIEFFNEFTSKWTRTSTPLWTSRYAQFRIKDAQKPENKEMEALIVLSPHAGPMLYAAAPDEANCILVFDGESNKLIKVEVKSLVEASEQALKEYIIPSQGIGSLNEFKRTGEL